MLFNSFHFLVFFPVVFLLYYATSPAWRWLTLLAASCYFYMAFRPVYILVLFFLILVDYTAGLVIERHEGRQRFWMLVVSILCNFGILAFFKYFKFFASSAGVPYPAVLDTIVLPLGLSFHTFQSVSYTIEVYRGKVKAERHLGIYAVYVLFFPQLVAGPIERPFHLMNQFREGHPFRYANVTSGLRLMLGGFVKKVVIADRLSLFVDMVYGDVHKYAGWPLAVATVFFAFQIYCDFSGYTDIARGAARTMGFDLMVNFNAPYLASSITDFWRRWHISLSTWFRDYLYIPLGGSRVAAWRRYANVMVVFVVSGLWHGANWTFAVWGAAHGALMIAYLFWEGLKGGESAFSPVARALSRVPGLGVLLTWAGVMAAWVFFRAATVHDAAFVLTHFAGGLTHEFSFGAWSRMDFALAIFSIGALLSVEAFSRRVHLENFVLSRPLVLRWGLYYAGLLLLFRFGQLGGNRFIYFQF